MICSFESHHDFKKVDPFDFGFTEDYMRAMMLDEEETD